MRRGGGRWERKEGGGAVHISCSMYMMMRTYVGARVFRLAHHLALAHVHRHKVRLVHHRRLSRRSIEGRKGLIGSQTGGEGRLKLSTNPTNTARTERNGQHSNATSDPRPSHTTPHTPNQTHQIAPVGAPGQVFQIVHTPDSGRYLE